MGKEIIIDFPGGKKIDAHFDGFTVHTDQPVAHGGEGSAPAPMELFLTSIAACGGLYAYEFCHARKLDTSGLIVKLKTDFDHETKTYRKILIEVTLPAGFPEKYKDAIVRAVDLCAVKKHLLNPPEFTIATKSQPV